MFVPLLLLLAAQPAPIAPADMLRHIQILAGDDFAEIGRAHV